MMAAEADGNVSGQMPRPTQANNSKDKSKRCIIVIVSKWRKSTQPIKYLTSGIDFSWQRYVNETAGQLAYTQILMNYGILSSMVLLSPAS